MNTYRAASLYFAIVFAAGFVLGTIRTLWLIPAFGELTATLIELPVIITIAWIACRWVLQRIAVPADFISRLTMGGLALLLLLSAEALLSISLGGLTLSGHFALYQKLPVILGLAGQVLYALFPLQQD